MIFSLPFHVPRYFRPTVLDVFELSNTSLGDIFAIYGITAMLAYFPGGAIADRYSAKKLMTISLIATSIGGLYMAQIPDETGLRVLYAYWGITSILLLWAALIRATRDWGGNLAQGKAFGLLDGGRGFVAAAAASLAVIIFSQLIPAALDSVNNTDRTHALQAVIYLYTILTLASGLLIWFFIPDVKNHTPPLKNSIHDMQSVLSKRIIWLQSIIVICAYCGYKGIDNYALYAVEVLDMNEVESASFTSLSAYLRPLAAITAGFLVDKFCASKIIKYGFLLLVISYFVLAISTPSSFLLYIIYTNLIVTFIAVFAIRGVYFALLEESNISKNITGTAVGLISVIGFTPDVFFASIAGRLLDANPGIEGHQHFFILLTVISVIGMITTIFFARKKTSNAVSNK
ncbi:MAG: nitrate/nitrite transporter NarK [Gammaproteobacteria bacterium]|jgi:nitrate/nitrite transporter NarK